MRDAATTLSMYRWNFSQYVECNSTSSSFLSTDASRHDAVAVLECKPSDALHVSRRSDILATLLLTSRSAIPDTRHQILCCFFFLFENTCLKKKRERRKKRKEKKKVSCISSIQYVNTSVAYRQSV